MTGKDTSVKEEDGELDEGDCGIVEDQVSKDDLIEQKLSVLRSADRQMLCSPTFPNV